ncbi:hypothetical protein [Chitinolyticbacter meiyuanensis]|uniref:hypothetical protein n=1 Tax=Chitinolyticbacter meiyuanensis TaxID=682798 RepID=UPI0011E5AA73|nr:hypothetical protein [Chitinolyticbacter meiyuanensis]
MKALVLGVRRQKGIAKASKKPYDMCTLIIGSPIQPAATEAFTKEGFGFEPGEIDLAVETLPQFEKVKFPAWLDLVTDNVMRFGRLQPIVIGYGDPQPQHKPA